MSAAATSKPPTVKLPSATVSIWRNSVGVVPTQSAAWVTLSGVGTAATGPAPLDSVVLDVVPSNCHAQLAGSLPRHALTSVKTCVVVLCSRYSCSLVHSSSIGLHVWLVTAAAVQRQQAGAQCGAEGGGVEGGGGEGGSGGCNGGGGEGGGGEAGGGEGGGGEGCGGEGGGGEGGGFGGGEGGGGEGGGDGGGGDGGGDGGSDGGGSAQTRSAVAVQLDTMWVYGAVQTVHAAHTRLLVAVQAVVSYSVPEVQVEHHVHARLLVAVQAVVSYAPATQVEHHVHARLLASVQAVVSYAPVAQGEHAEHPERAMPSSRAQVFTPVPARARVHCWLVWLVPRHRARAWAAWRLRKGTRATSDVLAAPYDSVGQTQPSSQSEVQSSCPAGRHWIHE